MEKIRNFLRLHPSDRWLFLNAFFALIGINLLLNVVPYNALRQSIAGQARRKKAFNPDCMEACRIADAVKLASRNTPGKSTCLVRALAGYYLMTKHDLPVEMYIGVKLGLPGQLKAHAWIMNQGEVILGYLEDLPDYTKLTNQSMKVA